MDRTPAEARDAAEQAIAAWAPTSRSFGCACASPPAATSPMRSWPCRRAGGDRGPPGGRSDRGSDRARCPAAMSSFTSSPPQRPRPPRPRTCDRVGRAACQGGPRHHDLPARRPSGSVSLHLKFPADLDLEAALAVARRIEAAIGSYSGVSDVQTHLEPMEQPLTTHPDRRQRERDERRQIEHTVAQQRAAHRLR